MNKISEKVFNIENYILKLYVIEESGIYYFGGSLWDNGIVDEAMTMGITDDYNRVVDIFRVLCENRVFPKHIECVVDEMWV